MPKNVLTEEQIKILTHLAYHAVGGQMCGGTADMDELFDFGFVKEVCVDHTVVSNRYEITEKGRKVLRDIEWDSNRGMINRFFDACRFRRKRGGQND